MRALSGAILTAGALVGLGLAAIGMGMRYQTYNHFGPDGKAQYVHFDQLDTWMLITLVALLAFTAIGLGITILGLAYHHHRREMEMLHRIGQRRHDTPPGEAKPADRISV
jgi:hypothetical protein